LLAWSVRWVRHGCGVHLHRSGEGVVDLCHHGKVFPLKQGAGFDCCGEFEPEVNTGVYDFYLRARRLLVDGVDRKCANREQEHDKENGGPIQADPLPESAFFRMKSSSSFSLVPEPGLEPNEVSKQVHAEHQRREKDVQP